MEELNYVTVFLKNNMGLNSEAYLEPCLIFKIELFAKIVSGWKPLIIFTKSSILDLLIGF